MKNIINLYKPSSITPINAIKKFKEKNKGYKKKSVSYAGRLDPIAEGVMPLIIGDETKNLKKYLKLDKTYKTKILFGIKTDSLDILGLPSKYNYVKIDVDEFKEVIKSFIGDYRQKIPAFSSKKINKKALVKLARKNLISHDELPERVVRIKNIKFNNIETINNIWLEKYIINKISKLDGDFRQEIIIKSWKNVLKNCEKLVYVSLTIDCSSGTYIRAIAEDLGKKLNTNAIVLELIRTRVGKYKIKDSVKI